MKKFLFTLLFLLTFNLVKAQAIEETNAEKHSNRPYHDQPIWISMMEDPQANYFEACKAFYIYWEGRELPAESEGEAKDLGDKEEEGLHFKDPKSYEMIYEYKRFKNWEKTMINRIDPKTGRILSSQELDAIWQEQTKGVNTHIE